MSLEMIWPPLDLDLRQQKLYEAAQHSTRSSVALEAATPVNSNRKRPRVLRVQRID
jgi:hypothetical protein